MAAYMKRLSLSQRLCCLKLYIYIYKAFSFFYWKQFMKTWFFLNKVKGEQYSIQKVLNFMCKLFNFCEEKQIQLFSLFHLLLEMMDSCFLVISGLSLLLEMPLLHTPTNGSEGASIFWYECTPLSLEPGLRG